MSVALVTGACGFAGQHLVETLRLAGHEVHGFSRPRADPDMVRSLFRNHHGDIRRYEDVRLVIERVEPEMIFHLAAQAYVPESGSDPRRGVDVNTVGTLNLLEAVRHTGNRARLLLAGTSEEYGYDHAPRALITEDTPCRPTTVYGVSKLAAGQLGLVYARQYGIPVVVTRAWNHTGPGQPAVYAVASFAKRVAEVEAGRRDAVAHGNLDAVRSYLDVRDVVRAYSLAIGQESGVYNVCGGPGSVVCLGDVLDTLIGLTGVSVKTAVDEALYRPGMTRGAEDFPVPDCAKLRAVTAWQPEYTLHRTLKDTLDHFREWM